MAQKNGSKKFEWLALFLSILLSINIFLLFNYDYIFPKKVEREVKSPTYYPVFIGNVSNYPIVEIYAPAVTANNKGVLTKFKVQAIPGTGRVLVNIKNILYWIDTQESIQKAIKVAQDFTKINTSNIDLIYDIEAEPGTVGGPSGGAALTLATIAALKNVTLRKDATITGTIELDGSIGPVGGIKEKTNAAKEGKLKYILVPVGEGEVVNYIPVERCEKIGLVKFCIVEYQKETKPLNESGIEVIEVSNIKEAWEFFSKNL